MKYRETLIQNLVASGRWPAEALTGAQVHSWAVKMADQFIAAACQENHEWISYKAFGEYWKKCARCQREEQD